MDAVPRGLKQDPGPCMKGLPIQGLRHFLGRLAVGFHTEFHNHIGEVWPVVQYWIQRWLIAGVKTIPIHSKQVRKASSWGSVHVCSFHGCCFWMVLFSMQPGSTSWNPLSSFTGSLHDQLFEIESFGAIRWYHVVSWFCQRVLFPIFGASPECSQRLGRWFSVVPPVWLRSRHWSWWWISHLNLT